MQPKRQHPMPPSAATRTTRMIPMTTPTPPIHRLQSRLRSILSQAKQEYELHDELRTWNDDLPEHLSAMFECEAALDLLPECVAADSFVSQDVATEYVQLLRLYLRSSKE